MAKPKAPFSNVIKPSDATILAASRGTAFKHCPSCGNSIISSAKYCPECARLVELGMHKRVYQPVGATDQRADTQRPQSYPSDKHSGYSDTISHRKIDPTRERY